MKSRFAISVSVMVLLLGLGCGDDEPTKPENTAPTAFFTAIPSSGTTETDFQFDASGSSDPNDADSLLVMRWDWDNDGTWDTAFSETKTATHRYGTAGIKTIKMEAKDTGGLTDETTSSVTVYEGSANMVLIPAGMFTMGSDPGEGAEDEEPEHQPNTSAYYMDLYEVTNTLYLAALLWAFDNGEAYWNDQDVLKSESDPIVYLETTSPNCRIDRSGETFTVETGYEDHPVVKVTWYGAAAFCNWRSGLEGLTPCYDTSTWDCNFSADGYRLPTEAEWEKGARGPFDERTYPWGDEDADCGRVNAAIDESCVFGTVPVGSYPSGISPYGLYDMAGNVHEWCNDWYSSTYYGSSPESDPRGPSSGDYRLVRGGSYSYGALNLRCACRTGAVSPEVEPWMNMRAGGFRTVRNQ